MVWNLTYRAAFSFILMVLLVGLLAPGVQAQEAPNVIQDNRFFVEQHYRDFLWRQGDAGGIDFWIQELEEERVTRAQVADEFFRSAEFQNNIAPVARLYFAYFNRIPDYAGLMFWVQAFQHSGSLDAISQAFADSAEFLATYGALEDGAFVDLVYWNVLGRAPDDAGRLYWIDALAGGASRGAMMIGLSESEEYRQRSLPQVLVTMMYVSMMGRAPDQYGFDYWVAVLEWGGEAFALIENFINSSEYAGRLEGLLDPGLSYEDSLDFYLVRDGGMNAELSRYIDEGVLDDSVSAALQAGIEQIAAEVLTQLALSGASTVFSVLTVSSWADLAFSVFQSARIYPSVSLLLLTYDPADDPIQLEVLPNERGGLEQHAHVVPLVIIRTANNRLFTNPGAIRLKIHASTLNATGHYFDWLDNEPPVYSGGELVLRSSLNVLEPNTIYVLSPKTAGELFFYRTEPVDGGSLQPGPIAQGECTSSHTQPCAPLQILPIFTEAGAVDGLLEIASPARYSFDLSLDTGLFPNALVSGSGRQTFNVFPRAAAPLMDPLADVAVAEGDVCTEYGMCGLEFTKADGVAATDLTLSATWGDNSALGRMTLQQCLHAGVCTDLGYGRYRIWHRYHVGSYSGELHWEAADGMQGVASFSVTVDQIQNLPLQAQGGDRSITLNWPALPADQYNLCRSETSVSSIDNCYVEGGRHIDLDIGMPPHVVSGLTNDEEYHFRLEGRFGQERILSNEAMATPQGASAGDLIAGRYEVIGADGGIIRDVETGLEWMRCSLGQTWDGSICSGSTSSHNFDAAQVAAQDLNTAGGYGGHADWRVPSIEELRTLVHCSSGEPGYFKNSNASCLGNYDRPTIVGDAFPNTPNSDYWSASTFADESFVAWMVNFQFGDALVTGTGPQVPVRLVRAGTTELIADRYEVIGADGGIIRDVVTGLEWMRCSLGQTWTGSTCSGSTSAHTFDGAQTAAQSLNAGGGYGGYADWQVPSIEELRTIVYCSSGSPAYFKNNNSSCSGSYDRPTIVSEAFPNTPSSFFWSGSPRASLTGYAWFVSFHYGYANYSVRSVSLRVRLVRGGQ